MKRTVLSKLTFFLLALMAVVLMLATWLEHQQGSAVAYRHVYHSWWFQVLWALIAGGGVWNVVQRKLWKRPFSCLLHVAFVVILVGAWITSLTATNGTLHLRAGQVARSFISDDRVVHPLPFAVQLLHFEVRNYPGTDAPANFVSTLNVGGNTYRVAMNEIAEIQSYRLYQTSYDTDKRGTVLSVYHDPWGIPITYTGYALMLLGFLGTLFAPQSTFYRLLRHPAWKKQAFVLLLFVGWGAMMQTVSAHPEYASSMAKQPGASSEHLQAISRNEADSIGRKQVVYNGRVCPFNTLAIDFCKKIYGAPNFRGLSAEQVLLSWLFFPEQWQSVPMIRIKNAALCERLGIKGEYASLEQLYDGNQYRLQTMLQAERDPASPLARAIQDTDEKVGLILMLHKGTLLRPLSEKEQSARLSDARITAEIVYNRVPTIKIGFMLNLTLGFLSFALLVVGWKRRWMTMLQHVLLGVSFVFLLTWFGFRWYLGGYVPLSNGFETMLFLAICVQAVALLLMRRFPFVLSFGAILSGFALLVAHLSDMNPQITSLMPVLASPLLSLHVTLMMLSYALFALMALNSAYALWLGRTSQQRVTTSASALRLQQLTLLNRLLLYPAEALLSIGIFIGAIWANVSWGRYWGWDPKEVWALITMLVYAFPLHAGQVPFLRSSRGLHLFLLLAFLSVLFTYFGVNYLLGGMHAYGNGG